MLKKNLSFVIMGAKMKNYHIYLLAFCLFIFVSCGQTDGNPVENPGSDWPGGSLSAAEKAVVASGNSFGFNLFNKINDSEMNKNVFVSPFSVSMAFGMVLNGADGPTLDSLKKVLGYAGISMDGINNSYKNISAVLTNLDAKVIFENANSIWYRNDFPVLQEFLDVNSTYFDSEVSALDFSSPGAVQAINGWVNTKTHEKIPTIIDRIPAEMVMYLINAIYYKGTWTYQFDTQNTQDASFTCADGSTVSCELMEQEATFAYYSNTGMQVIDLPYGDRKFSMTVILPSTGTSIDQFASTLTQEQWNTIVAQLDSSEVVLSLPKFKLEYKRKLNDDLKAMGMGIAFSDFADFSRISQKYGITISEVLHKTFVEVNEEGTEAAAVTSIGMRCTSIGGPSKPIMRIDHPFIFAIREHQSGTILFIGKIVNPAES
ncbi:MAG: serpin family protein [Bacteroidetes bacterium]|nr:serpin family protein [Bacteroidota bacterium]